MCGKLFFPVPLILLGLLMSCGGLQSTDPALPGSPIYQLSTGQLPGKPSTLVFQLDIDASARQALKDSLQEAYLQPEVLYFWLAVQSPDHAYDLMGYETFRAIYRLPLSKDEGVLHYEGSFDLLDLKQNAQLVGLSWLEDSLFDPEQPEANLTGYGLMVSDGWWSAGPAGYVYESVAFRDNLPDGQGRSNLIQVVAEAAVLP